MDKTYIVTIQLIRNTYIVTYTKRFHQIQIKKFTFSYFYYLKNISQIYHQKKLNIQLISNGKSSYIYCTSKIHKFKSVQEAIVLANDDYIEIKQPNDLKGRPIISGPQSPIQRLSCIIETLLKSVVPHVITQQIFVLLKRFLQDFSKKSFVFVFRRRIQNFFKTSWSKRIYLPYSYIFKRQDVFKTS